jgi:hypothetical protein
MGWYEERLLIYERLNCSNFNKKSKYGAVASGECSDEQMLFSCDEKVRISDLLPLHFSREDVLDFSHAIHR